MIPLYAFLGALIGLAVFFEFGGLVAGAAIGALLGVAQRLGSRVGELERSLAALRESAARSAVRAADAATAARAAEPEATVRGEPTATPTPGAATITAPQATPIAVTPSAAAVLPAAASARAAQPAAVIFERSVSEPSLFDRALATALRWITTGNVPVKVGVVLSLFGMGFLIKEGIDRGWLVLPIEARLILVALFGVFLLGLGWRLRGRSRIFALSIQGGGIGMLYMTVYAAFAVFGLLPSALAFALLVAVTAAAGALAVLQDAKAMAVLGIVGGFLAPVLVGSDMGDHVLLFSYYAILNGAIVGVAWFKSWRELNVLGFLFTFGIGSLWGARGYEPEHFATTEPFLIFFTILYTIVPILFARRAPPNLLGVVDGTLVFGTPVVAFALQRSLVGDTEYGLAISAVVLAAYYAALAVALRYRAVAAAGQPERRDALRPLVAPFTALAVGFVTLAVPLAFGGDVTSAVWALEGAAVVWLGVRQQRGLSVYFGLALQVLAAGMYARDAVRAPADWLSLNDIVFNERFLGAVVLAAAGFLVSAVLDGVRGAASDAARDAARGAPTLSSVARDAERDAAADARGTARIFPPPSPDVRRLFAALSLGWAGAWWYFGGFVEIAVQAPADLVIVQVLALVGATTLAATFAAAALEWPRLDWLALVAWPAAVVMLVIVLATASAPSEHYRALGWALALAAMYCFLRMRETRWPAVGGGLHATAFWVLTALLAIEAFRRVGDVADGVWPAVSGMAVLALGLAALVVLRIHRGWPFAQHARAYLLVTATGVASALGVLLVFGNFVADGNAPPLRFVPLLNPLELVMLGAGWVIWRWSAALADVAPERALPLRQRAGAAALAAWLFVTMAVARGLHHWAGVPFTFEALADSAAFQATLALVWGLGASLAMVVGARRGERVVWFVGAALFGLVVVKLVLVDLQTPGAARVVALLGVGALGLVTGYLSPIPPRGGREIAARPELAPSGEALNE